MTGYKNFALVGAGLIGGFITDDLLKAKSGGRVDRIIILSRPVSLESRRAIYVNKGAHELQESVGKLEAYAARGATVVPIKDYSSGPEVIKALSGVEVVISTLPSQALHLQLPISEAARVAGVQLFVPSEYGLSTDNHTEGLLAGKATLDKQIRDSGLATARFFVGMFGDCIWVPLLNLDFKSVGGVEIGGDGSAKVSFTSSEDISRFVVYVLTELPREEVKNRTFRIEGELTVRYILPELYSITVAYLCT